jgi:two-component sensor histidine kinase
VQQYKRISVIVSWLAGVILGMMVLIFPVSYFCLSLRHMTGNLETEAEINARLVTRIVNANPRMWEFENLRLEEYLSRRPVRGDPEIRRIKNKRNEVVAESADPLPTPFLVRSAKLYDSGIEVGRLEIYRSLRPLLLNTGLITLVMLPIGLGTFVILRTVPLRSIARAENALRRSNEELELKVRSRTALLEGALREKETLLQEIYHRTKNNMQVIIALLRLQLRSISDPAVEEIFRDTEDRIMSMSLVHEKLYQSGDLSNLDLREYLGGLSGFLLESFGMEDRVKLSVDVEDIPLSIDSITPLGLIVNELMTNSLKYAFPNGNGEIKLTGRLLPTGEIEVRCWDNGKGLPRDLDLKKVDSLGLRLVHTLSELQLGGNIELGRASGTEFILRFREPKRRKRLQVA